MASQPASVAQATRFDLARRGRVASSRRRLPWHDPLATETEN
ncbi:protein of unknown function [Burkholderia multivorans]